MKVRALGWRAEGDREKRPALKCWRAEQGEPTGAVAAAPRMEPACSGVDGADGASARAALAS
jgi:hypothetical protein